MMYNPYNWKIKKTNIMGDPSIIDEKIEKRERNCILEDLGALCAEIELKKIEKENLNRKIKEIEKIIMKLEEEKMNLLNYNFYK